MLMLTLFLMHVLIFSSEVSGQQKESESTFRKLRDTIFQGYDVNARPVSHHDNTTDVEIGFTPIHVTLLDENNGMLTMEGWVSMHWRDEHLQWNPAKYSGLNVLRVSDKEVWKPDIAVYNGRGNRNMPWSSVNGIVNNSGYVWWIPPASFQLICGVSNYIGYPEDTQECKLILGSWTTDGNNINLILSNENGTLEDYYSTANPHWELLSVTGKRKITHYDCCPEPYVSVEYKLKLKRTNVPFSALCSTPDTVARVLILCMFWIPNGTRKLMIGCTTFVILAAIAVGITATLPSPAAAPYALVQVNSAFALCMSALLVEILVMAIASFRIGSPSWLDGLASSTLCQMLSPCNHEEYREDLMETSANRTNQWPFLATLIDRAAFVIFAILLLSL